MPNNILKTHEEGMKEFDKLKTKCPHCNGDGFTVEHDSPITHDPDTGECTSCPVQEQCHFCHATGFVYPSSIKSFITSHIINLLKEEVKRLDGTRKKDAGEMPFGNLDAYVGYNHAIDELITHYNIIIKELEKNEQNYKIN